MEEFKIEKGIAVPSPRTNVLIFPFEQMEVGDSFAVPVAHHSAVAAAMTGANKRWPGQRFASRKLGDVIRIWRVK